MNCAYCITNQFHMVVIQQPDKSFHVHAPFHDKKMMKVMEKEIIKAQKNWEKKDGTNSDSK